MPRAHRWLSIPDRQKVVLGESPGVLIGRDEELDRLQSLIADVEAGRGGSVWLDGEPGIGKSALLAAGLADAENAGCGVFAARAEEAGMVFPLRLLLDAMRVGPHATDPGRAEIAERLWGTKVSREVTNGDPTFAAAELLLVLVDRLCATGPVVVAADDLQWSDELSLAVWARLHHATGQLPLLLIASARPVPVRPEVYQLHRALTETGAVELRLDGLRPAGVTALLRRLVSAEPGPGLLGLAAQAGGNPLYLRELLNALVLEKRIQVRGGVADLVEGGHAAPRSLSAAIRTRLSFLSESATTALRAATVLGNEFHVEHLSVITGQAATNLIGVVHEGLSAGVLGESGTALAFRHPLIRHALYEGMPAALRADLHREAARRLAAARAPAERVAQQLVAVPDVAGEWILEWLITTAPTLASRSPDIAADLLQRLRQTTDSTDPRRAQLDAHLVTALFQLSRYQEIDALARPLLARTQEPAVAGELAWTLAHALTLRLRFPEALAVARDALNDLALTATWTARLRAMCAMILTACARFEEGEAVATRADAEATRAGDPLAAGYALVAHAMVEQTHRHDEARGLAMVDRALDLAGRSPQTTNLRLLLLENRFAGLSNLGHRVECERALGEALALAERSGSPGRLAALRIRAGGHCYYSGRWDDAVAELDAASQLPVDPARALMLRGYRSLIAIHRDDLHNIDKYLWRREDPPPDADAWYLTFYLVVARAAAAERDNLPGEALQRLFEAIDPAGRGEFGQLHVDACWWLPDLVRLALALGDAVTAEEATRVCAAETDRNPLPRTHAAANQCRGLLDADPALLMSAADAYRHIGVPLWSAQALESAAVLLADRGDTAAARTVYTDALRFYADLDAAWDIRRADARMRAFGIRRSARRRPATTWKALTPTEIKIARLIAAGKSNTDIAADLHLSRNTVQTHVSHILTKLNVHSRVDVAREIIRRTPQAVDGKVCSDPEP